MFSLSPAGRHNLEAICVELERAARQHPPLFHQQLKPWSVKGEVRITEPQWAAFIENEGLSEDAWCEWHGPFDDFLGIWYGCPDGMETFCNLSESIKVILNREDFSDIDPFDLPRDFDSLHGWVETLHKWALKFQLPLLRCEIDLWNSEGQDGDDASTFVRLSQTWGGVGDVPYPLHPVVNSLRDDVFTSSLAALRALLRPDLVIDTNEPWPLLDVAPIISAEDADRRAAECTNEVARQKEPAEYGSKHGEIVHRLVQTPLGWMILPAHGGKELYLKSHQTGLHRIAKMMERPNTKFDPEWLVQFGGRKYAQTRTTPTDDDRVADGDLRKMANLGGNVTDTTEHLDAIGKELKRWMAERKKAQDEGDTEAYAEADKKITDTNEVYELDSKGKVRVKRQFQDNPYKDAYDTVAATIRGVIKELEGTKGCKQMGEELRQQFTFPELRFVPLSSCVRWEVDYTP